MDRRIVSRQPKTLPRVIYSVTFVTCMITFIDPGSTLFGSTRRAILTLTFLRPDESFYLREIVRRTGCGLGPVQRELKVLTEAGILRRDRQRFFQANPESPIYEPLKQIVVRTVGLGDRLRSALAPIADSIAVAFIFGSFPRGEQHERSDVDVLVVTKNTNIPTDKIDSELARELKQIGREVNPFVMTVDEWKRKWSAGNPFVRRVFDGEKVYLVGGADELKRLAKKRLAQTPSTQLTGNTRLPRPGQSRPQKREGQRSRQRLAIQHRL